MAQGNDRGSVIYEGNVQCIGGCPDWCRKTRFLITTTFVEREYGICCKSIDHLQYIRIKDIRYTGWCCDAACNCCGTITIWSSDQSTPELKITGLPNIRGIYDQIRNAYNAASSNAKLEIAT